MSEIDFTDLRSTREEYKELVKQGLSRAFLEAGYKDFDETLLNTTAENITATYEQEVFKPSGFKFKAGD
jgi:hypothetical protein